MSQSTQESSHSTSASLNLPLHQQYSTWQCCAVQCSAVACFADCILPCTLKQLTLTREAEAAPSEHQHPPHTHTHPHTHRFVDGNGTACLQPHHMHARACACVWLFQVRDPGVLPWPSSARACPWLPISSLNHQSVDTHMACRHVGAVLYLRAKPWYVAHGARCSVSGVLCQVFCVRCQVFCGRCCATRKRKVESPCSLLFLHALAPLYSISFAGWPR